MSVSMCECEYVRVGVWKEKGREARPLDFIPFLLGYLLRKTHIVRKFTCSEKLMSTSGSPSHFVLQIYIFN